MMISLKDRKKAVAVAATTAKVLDEDDLLKDWDPFSEKKPVEVPTKKKVEKEKPAPPPPPPPPPPKRVQPEFKNLAYINYQHLPDEKAMKIFEDKFQYRINAQTEIGTWTLEASPHFAMIVKNNDNTWSLCHLMTLFLSTAVYLTMCAGTCCKPVKISEDDIKGLIGVAFAKGLDSNDHTVFIAPMCGWSHIRLYEKMTAMRRAVEDEFDEEKKLRMELLKMQTQTAEKKKQLTKLTEFEAEDGNYSRR